MNTRNSPSPRMVVGCMTGTSLDALDLALVEVRGSGYDMEASLVRASSTPLDQAKGNGGLGACLWQLANQESFTAGKIAAVATQFGELHARAIDELLGGQRIDLVCAHGQTVFHKPPASWQLLNAAPIAAQLGVPVVFDLRAADLAAGGQGAPITPVADLVMFGDNVQGRSIVNLGGFCNVTLLPAGPKASIVNAVDGFDLCACNHVLDQVARKVLDAPFDEGGRAALAGVPIETAVSGLVKALAKQRVSRCSLGTGDETRAWLNDHARGAKPNDLAASACAALGRVIGAAISGGDRVILAGGGVRNAALVAAIRSSCGGPVVLSDTLGAPAAYREAMAMAVLGALCQDRVPITLPRVTGCRRPAPVAGVWVLP